MKVFLKILMWVAIVAVVILVVMWLSIKISGNFDSFGDLFAYLGRQFQGGDAGTQQPSVSFRMILPALMRV